MHLNYAVWAATLASVIGCASACQCLRLRLYLPPGASWASWETPEASCCGSAAEVVSSLFGRSSRDTASEICHLWVPAAGMAGAATAVGAGSALANNSLTATRSSSLLEMMTGEVPLDMICKGKEGKGEKWKLASYVVVS